jgi:RNA polymerase sigma-70 factor (ECF subfamily)
MVSYTNHKNLSNELSPEDLFCECYSQFRKSVYSYLLRLTSDSVLASNLTQNVFLKFWTLRDQYSMIGDAKAYLKRIEANAFRDTSRQDKNRVAYFSTVSYSTTLSQHLTEAMLDEKELERIFQQAVLNLSRQKKDRFCPFSNGNLAP